MTSSCMQYVFILQSLHIVLTCHKHNLIGSRGSEPLKKSAHQEGIVVVYRCCQDTPRHLHHEIKHYGHTAPIPEWKRKQNGVVHGNVFSTTGPWEGNSPVTGGLPSQRTSNELRCLLLLDLTSCWTNNPVVSDLRRNEILLGSRRREVI